MRRVLVGLSLLVLLGCFRKPSELYYALALTVVLGWIIYGASISVQAYAIYVASATGKQLSSVMLPPPTASAEDARRISGESLRVVAELLRNSEHSETLVEMYEALLKVIDDPSPENILAAWKIKVAAN